MQRKLAVVFYLVVLTGNICARAEEQDIQTNSHIQLLSEVLGLQADLMYYLMEAQRQHVLALTSELERVRQEQKRVRDEDRQNSELTAELQQQLATSNVEPEARKQMEALRGQLIDHGVGKLRTEQSALVQREANLTQLLEQEGRKGQDFQEKARKLRAALAQR